jgi:predicted RNA-binding protein with PUA-like domain
MKKQYWWVTASERNPRHRWHWDEFFQHPMLFDWGGQDWIKSKMSHARIEEMNAGDIIVAYQANEGIVGLACLDSGGYRGNGGRSPYFDTFDLKRKPIVRLDHSVIFRDVRDLPDAKNNFEFCKVKQGTVFRITITGFNQVLHLMMKSNPGKKNAIRAVLAVGGKH